MSVSDLDEHDPAIDIGGTMRIPGSALRVRDVASPLRARNTASPLRTRDVSSPDLGARRVGFMLDPPVSKKHEQPHKEVCFCFSLLSFLFLSVLFFSFPFLSFTF